MLTTLDLPEPLLRSVRAEAALRGVDVGGLVTSYLEQGLADTSSSAKEAKTFPEPVKDFTGFISAKTNAEMEEILAQSVAGD
jgi:hypothetical protein